MPYSFPDREDCCLPLLLQKLLKQLKKLNKRMKIMNEQLATLTDRVAAIETVGDSAIALLHGLKAQLDEAIASGDMAGVQDLSDRLAAQTQELAEAITANTVAAPDLLPPPMDGADPE